MKTVKEMTVVELNQLFGFTAENTIFTLTQSYGYKIDITHPIIKPLYDTYRKAKGIPPMYPMSDAERFDFEDKIFTMLQRRENEMQIQKNQLTSTRQSEIS